MPVDNNKLPVTQLRLPSEFCSTLHTAADEPTHHITGMNINGTNGHDLLALLSCQLPK